MAATELQPKRSSLKPKLASSVPAALAARRQRTPAKKGELKKEETIAPIRLTADEKALIYEAAKKSNQTVSEFIVNNILRISLKVMDNSLITLSEDDLSRLGKKSKITSSISEKMKKAVKDAELLNQRY